MPKAPNLSDVARAANLSAATVSRYLNGSLRLPPETIRRIEAAVAALDYQPNPHARSLSRGRSDTIGLLLPDIANPFFARLAAAIEASADARGLGVMLCATLNKPSREIDYLARLRRNRVDGLLFATNHADDGRLAEAMEAVPDLVLLDEDVAGALVPKVFSDNRQGGHLAALHFIEFGHSCFAYIGGPQDLMSARERGAGFARTIREAGPGCVIAAELYGDYSRRHGETAARAVLDRHPDVTAIFAGSDEILLGLLTVLRQRDLRVGADLSIVTFDDAAPLEIIDPPITAIRQPIEDIGRVALDCLMEARIGGALPRIERLPVGLMPRQSVRRPARAGTRGQRTKKDQNR